MKLKIGLVVVVALVSIILVSCSQQTEPKLTVRERQLIESSRSSLAQLAETSQAAKELLLFFDNEATLAKYIDKETFQVVEDPQSPHFFYVVADTTKPVLGEQRSYVAAEFDIGIRCLTLYDYQFSGLVQGLFLAHELQHAMDCVLGGEKVSTFISVEWLMGEYHALWTVKEILNQHTEGEWEEIALTSRAKRESLSIALGHDTSFFTFGPAPGDSSRIVALFGNLAPDDYNSLVTQMIIDANMYNVKEIAGADTMLFFNGALDFLETFYSTYGAH